MPIPISHKCRIVTDMKEVKRTDISGRRKIVQFLLSDLTSLLIKVDAKILPKSLGAENPCNTTV